MDFLQHRSFFLSEVTSQEVQIVFAGQFFNIRILKNAAGVAQKLYVHLVLSCQFHSVRQDCADVGEGHAAGQKHAQKKALLQALQKWLYLWSFRLASRFRMMTFAKLMGEIS